MTHGDHPQGACHFTRLKVRDFQSGETDWSVIWKLIVNDEWFQGQLQQTARRLLGRSSVSVQRIDDLTQDVQLLLAGQLQRQPGLGFDPARGALHSFLRALIRNLCLQALEQNRGQPLPTESLKPHHLANDDWRREQFAGELRRLAFQLDEPFKTTARLFLRGFSVTEIAERRKLSKRTIYRHLNVAADYLRFKNML